MDMRSKSAYDLEQRIPGEHVKVVYHKDENNGATHALRNGKPGETPENASGAWHFPKLVTWSALNTEMRNALNAHQPFGSRITVSFNDSRPSAYAARTLDTNNRGKIRDITPPVAPTFNSIINNWSAKCLDVEGGNATAGTDVRQYACNGTNAQKWVFTANGTFPGSGNFAKYSIQSGVSHGSNNYCLDNTNGNTSDMGGVQIWYCPVANNPAVNQAFYILSEEGSIGSSTPSALAAADNFTMNRLEGFTTWPVDGSKQVGSATAPVYMWSSGLPVKPEHLNQRWRFEYRYKI